MKKISHSKRLFTLIEMLISIALLLLVASLFTIKIRQALSEERFRAEEREIVSLLNLAVKRMLFLGEDLDVVFRKEESGLTLEMIRVTPPARKNEVLLLPPKIHLKSVKKVLFKGESESFQDNVTLHFSSYGSKMSEGNLFFGMFSDEDEDFSRWICLPGYPDIIKIKTKKQVANCINPSGKRALIQDTYHIIMDEPS